ncbi:MULTISPECIES: hypothetical protein [unclassified Gordonia (in: high G+C Gram-positive bacteria)]|uniref:hypothetical protein n=1 Tax=unclassified Gordonia (in: high G+C Gram-positive bacteria) TaxID=2657482 RepID=UPI00071DE32F|nr:MULTISPECIES: hypothetical protein [unclassified Gordonia (in: high G+C Gram-positive bacteria)]KSU56122.1 hypothetical protein AS181_18950 [Gordonia sp. SGD-V-85]SCC49329.1 hypothetical protein GA0061091_11928 [Gordonia sp. v-85]
MAPSPQIVGVREVEVDDVDYDPDNGDHTVYVGFTLLVLCDLFVEGYYLDNSGVTVMGSGQASDVVVSVPCVAELDQDRTVATVRQSDTADAEPAEQRFSDPQDAFAWFLDTLESMSGIVVKTDNADMRDPSIPGRLTVYGDGGSTVVVDIVQNDPGESWRADSDEVGTIMYCEYDVNSRAWLGRHDSFDRYPPYTLSSAPAHGQTRGPWPGIAAVWRAASAEV